MTRTLFPSLTLTVAILLALVGNPASAQAPETPPTAAPAPTAADPAAPAPMPEAPMAEAPMTAPPVAGEATPAPTVPAGAAVDGKESGVLFFWSGALVVLIWLLALLASLAALFQAWLFYKWLMDQDEGTERMIEIAGFVREGANAYLWQQYSVVAGFFAVIVVLLAIAAFGFNLQSTFVPFAFLTGGFFSGLAGWIGMKTATSASNRTAAAAQESLNKGLQVAFRSGAVMGLTVVGLGLLDICIWFGLLYWVWPLFFQALTLENITVTMLCFGMGASSQALFARVGGGIFTKAADVGADLVGKVEENIPEDDPRNPATIADNVGDNVGDVAGMGADLYESYCGAILASAALGVAAFTTEHVDTGGLPALTAQLFTLMLPLAISAGGIFVSIAGIYLVRTEEDASQKNLLAALGRGITSSTLGVIVVAVLLALFLMPKIDGTTVFGFIPGISFSVIVGLAAGYYIGQWTEYCTSDEYTPTRELAEQALTGPATVIIGGIAEGMMSTWMPVLIVGVATLLSFGFANGFRYDDMNYFALGLYGVGISAVGMLSTLGITLATDAYGPIADNAGGNAQMSHLPPQVRERTDALDSLGNTTAATGKGFAIGSAALTALALAAAYVEEVRIGFERWGESAAVSLPAGAQEGIYKINQTFAVEAVKNPNPNSSPLVASRGFLIMPSDLRDLELKAAWDKIDLAKGPALVDAALFQSTPQVKGPPVTKFAPAGVSASAPLVDVKLATLPEFTTYYEATLMNPKVLVGLLVGAMATFVFCALTMKAVGRAARGMVEEVRRQFRENPDLLTDEYAKPDYAMPVAISTKAAQYEMILPSVLALVLPVVVGILLGVGGVLGLLMGTLSSGFCVAVFMANAGGAWDNAKKYIEAENLAGHAKGSGAHKAAVVGDTVGDPFKDTSGPSLNILIKLMSMVSVVAAGLVVRYSLHALGIF